MEGEERGYGGGKGCGRGSNKSKHKRVIKRGNEQTS